MDVAHPFPEPLVLEETVPHPADSARAGEGPWIVDEAEDVKGEFRGKIAQEVSPQERSDGGRDEEQLLGSAFGEEGG